MKKSKVLDFDRFMEEKKHETMEVKVYGKTYTVKKEIPAMIMVELSRAEMDENATVGEKMLFKAADCMFGKEAVTEMCAAGMSGREMTELVSKLFRAITGNLGDDDEDDDTEEFTDEDSRTAMDGGKASKKA